MSHENPLNIVIVDDSESIRVVMQAILHQLSISQVTNCSSGEQALEVIEQKDSKYTLIFVDLNMPNMDGMELIRHLGERNFKGGVVIASGMDGRIIKLASEIAKQNEIHLITSLVKPITEAKLTSALYKFNSFIDRIQSASLELTATELKQAMDNGLLTPYYQPKVDIRNHQIIGIELLARIDAPGKGGSIPAGRFLSVAEANNLIDDMTFTLLEKAMIEFKSIQHKIGSNFSFAFNLSPNQLENFDNVKKIDDFFKQYNLPAEKVVIEITEEYAIKTTKQLETLNRLRIKGYGVALDDFGTGFTNIPQLLNLPFTEVKIDRNLITDIHTDHFSQVIVNTLIEIKDQLGIKLVAEGIESINELNYLVSLDADIAIQGYIVSKPKPKEAFLRWYNGWAKQESEIVTPIRPDLQQRS